MMAEHALLVPIGLEALAVNQTDKHSTIWSLGHKQYTGIDKFEPLEPPPFIRGNNWPRTGITLHWALPNALTRGRQEDNGLVFPFIPNRWLVVRTFVDQAIETSALSESAGTLPPSDATKESVRLRAWVVESDYLGSDGSNLYPDPRSGGRSLTKIGRSWDLADWLQRSQSAVALSAPHLTAIGPGDTTFTAYLANIDNVLTFHDALNDLEDIEQPLSLSYLVVGWHAQAGPDSTPQNWQDPDPLAARRWQTPPDEDDGLGDHAEERWIALMKRYRWSFGSDQDLRYAIEAAWGERKADPLKNYPTRTVYHGQVYGVKWTGMHGLAQTGPLSRQKETGARRTQAPQVAFGNSAIDGLASLMEYFLEREDDHSGIATLIQALEYSLVQEYDQPGGQVSLDQRIHAEWFAGLPGGTDWDLVAAPKQETTQLDALNNGRAIQPSTIREIRADLSARLRAAGSSNEQSIALSAALGALEGLVGKLAALNRQQRVLDLAKRALRSSQAALYALWWKSKRFPFLHNKPAGLDQEDIAEEIKKSKVALAQEQAKLTENVGEVNRIKQALDEITRNPEGEVYRLLNQAGVNLQLRQGSAPRFYQPADPVALIYGMHRSAKHGEDGRFHADGSLFVRFSRAIESAAGQTIQSLGGITGPGLISLFSNTAPETLRNIQAGMNDGHIPPEALDLIVESTVLDVTLGGILAGIFGESAKNTPRRQQMIWQDYRQHGVSPAYLTRAAGFSGVRPSPVAVEKWTSPWSPLFLCWRVTWYPSDPNPEQALRDWRFNGLDFDWTGRRPVEYERATTLQGRTMLIRTSTDAMQEHLEGLFKQLHGSSLPAAAADALEQVKSRLQAADLLSHPLTGFNDQLIMQDPKQFFNPDDPEVWGLIGDVRRAAPMPYQATSGDSHFHPIRGGHFRLQRLWVVDTYGQVFDPIYEQGVTPASFTPVRGTGLVPPGKKQRTDTQMLQLPPRLIQASRLQFRFVPAGAPSVGAQVNGNPILPASGSSQDGDDNPICGWLLPNHLDNSLVIFNPQGRMQGAIMLAGSASKSNLIWAPPVPADSNAAGSTEAPDLGNPHLQAFIAGLLEHSEPDQAFTGLMATIDSSLWTTDPLGQRTDNLSTLIGRPLALVRASLALEFAEEPVSDQSWANTLSLEKRDWYKNVYFPVELGNINLREDGTLGYFIEPAGENKRLIDYSRLYTLHETSGIVATNYFADRRFAPPLQVQPGTPVEPRDRQVTLILDPRGSVQARSGILPVKTIQLPAYYVEPALANMDVTFRIGPIINEPRGMRMPLPAEIRGGWSWIAHTGVNLWPEQEIRAADQHAGLAAGSYTLREGWLKLSDALGDPGKSPTG